VFERSIQDAFTISAYMIRLAVTRTGSLQVITGISIEIRSSSCCRHRVCRCKTNNDLDFAVHYSKMLYVLQRVSSSCIVGFCDWRWYQSRSIIRETIQQQVPHSYAMLCLPRPYLAHSDTLRIGFSCGPFTRKRNLVPCLYTKLLLITIRSIIWFQIIHLIFKNLPLSLNNISALKV
jgi:hypothetical protein